jgi:hypothetical protein
MVAAVCDGAGHVVSSLTWQQCSCFWVAILILLYVGSRVCGRFASLVHVGGVITCHWVGVLSRAIGSCSAQATL